MPSCAMPPPQPPEQTDTEVPTRAAASALRVPRPFSSFFQMFGISFVLQSLCALAKPISVLALGHHL